MCRITWCRNCRSLAGKRSSWHGRKRGSGRAAGAPRTRTGRGHSYASATTRDLGLFGCFWLGRSSGAGLDGALVAAMDDVERNMAREVGRNERGIGIAPCLKGSLPSCESVMRQLPKDDTVRQGKVDVGCRV